MNFFLIEELNPSFQLSKLASNNYTKAEGKNSIRDVIENSDKNSMIQERFFDDHSAIKKMTSVLLK